MDGASFKLHSFKREEKLSKNKKFTKQDVKDFWNENVCQTEFIKDKKVGTKPFFEEAERIRYKHHFYLPALFKHISELKPKGKLLEIGCGMGTDIVQLVRNGFDVTGIDLTSEAIDLAKKRFKIYNLKGKLKTDDAENLSFEEKTFDVVYSFGVLHHTPNTQKAIDETYRVLKDDGVAIIMLYHRNSFNYVVHKLLNAPFDGNKKNRCPIERCYSKKEVYRLFNSYSVVNLSIEYFMTTGFGFFWDLVPRFIHKWFGKSIGWHIIVEARKNNCSKP